MAISEGVTASEVVAENNKEDVLFEQRKQEAAAAGVFHANQIGYADDIKEYEGRSDIETLAARRARSIASDVSAQDFMRTVADDEPVDPTP